MFITFLNDKTETCLQVITVQDRLNMLEEDNKKNNELMQSKAREDEWAQKQTHGQKHSLLESRAHRQASHLLRRAFEIKQDQEDEVRTLFVTKDRGHNIRH
jgi:hypothetical protein